MPTTRVWRSRAAWLSPLSPSAATPRRSASFNAAAHDKTIDRYTKSLRAIRGELPRAIPAALLQKRRFDANAASGQIGGLRRQLDRRRGGMSVRGLIEHFGELITQIMPCTLMSPDSVARFFPARPDLFDIVVFDEASQIRVADAIGAMGRSRSVVVVGDSKQMPPTSFAEANANIDDDENSDQEFFLDEESILTECVHAQVPQQWLSWHYRSQDEALIAFSNQHYYNRRLASFPAPRADSASGWWTRNLADTSQRHVRARRKGENPADQPRRGRCDRRRHHHAVPEITGRRAVAGRDHLQRASSVT